ncbi:hypothetical protein AURDEDRAFT_160815 [Auricularia subglabra TFB-10046 SS5]|nr:hypothetical protein AURDEDRAFT_160815 [Auricularia subglabra TFB-10046 SS5]
MSDVLSAIKACSLRLAGDLEGLRELLVCYDEEREARQQTLSTASNGRNRIRAELYALEALYTCQKDEREKELACLQAQLKDAEALLRSFLTPGPSGKLPIENELDVPTKHKRLQYAEDEKLCGPHYALLVLIPIPPNPQDGIKEPSILSPGLISPLQLRQLQATHHVTCSRAARAESEREAAGGAAGVVFSARGYDGPLSAAPPTLFKKAIPPDVTRETLRLAIRELFKKAIRDAPPAAQQRRSAGKTDIATVAS